MSDAKRQRLGDPHEERLEEGFRLPAFGFFALGLGFLVLGLGFRVQVLRFRVLGLGLRVQVLGLRKSLPGRASGRAAGPGRVAEAESQVIRSAFGH